MPGDTPRGGPGPALVFLHGPPASGKLTTARALRTELGYPVFHNHLTVDLLTTVFPFGSEPFVRLREQFWLAVFVDAARARRSLVFTFTPDATVRHGFTGRVREAVESEGGRVCFVRLDVSETEQERRITSEDRRRFHKLSDLATLRRLRDEREDVEQPPCDLRIDTDSADPRRSAALIIERFTLGAQELLPRYPPVE